MNNAEYDAGRLESLMRAYRDAQFRWNAHLGEIMEAEAKREYRIVVAQLDELTNGLWGLNE